MLIHVITGFTAQIKFSFNWKVTLLGVCLFPFLLMLGFWQLDRAAEKQSILDLQQQQRTLPAIALEQLRSSLLFDAPTSSDILVNSKIQINTDALAQTASESNDTGLHYRKVIVRGSLDIERYWLLDNKVRSGRVGYEVVVPLRLESNQQLSVLVNLGWLESQDRTSLPSIALPSGVIEISGLLTSPSSNAVFNNTTSRIWPKRVLHIDTQSAAESLDFSVNRHVLLIDDFEPLALTTGWKLVNQTPAKHHGYAVQWFAMAMALMIAMLFASTNLATLIHARKQSRDIKTPDTTHNKNSKEVQLCDHTNR